MIKACDICNLEMARYTCKNCGATVCEYHFDSKLEICSDCASKI